MPEILYQRTGAVLRLRMKDLTNHEIREVLVGLWSRLDKDDQEDHIKELEHYLHDPQARLSPLAASIAEAAP